MKTSFVLSTLALIAAAIAQTTNLTINTPPQLVTCQPALLQWAGGVAPYYLSVLPGGQVSATAIESFPTQTGTTYTWSAVNIAAGTSITLEVRDSSGQTQYSSPVVIQQGSDASCVGQSLSGSGATAATTGSMAASASASSPAKTTAASASASATSASAASAASASATTKSSAMGLKAGALSAVGIAGLVGAALF